MKVEKRTKLNLGSGNEPRNGWINMDIDPKWKPDVLCDIEKGIPLKSNTVEVVFTKHVLEHIEPRSFAFVLSEIHRVCKNGAIVHIFVPYFSCSITYKTPDHLTPFSYFTFMDNDQFKIEKRRLYFFRKSFGYRSRLANSARKILNPILSFFPNSFPLIYERIFCWIFPVEELEVVLRVKK